MIQSAIVGCRAMNCFRHKIEPVTHICTDLKCTNAPVLCGQCLKNQLNRAYHFDHERSLISYHDAVSIFCSQIKSQTSAMQKIFKTTLARPEFNGLLGQLEKGSLLYEELDSRIINIKAQVDLDSQLMMKEFKRLITAEKQEYFRLLQNYQKSFVNNFEYFKSQAQAIFDFNNSVKYYSNANNFQLKLSLESRKKSDWMDKTKKLLADCERIIDNPNSTSQLSNTINAYLRVKMDSIPAWKQDESWLTERNADMKNMIRKAMGKWPDIPEMRCLEEESQNGSHGHTGTPRNSHY